MLDIVKDTQEMLASNGLRAAKGIRRPGAFPAVLAIILAATAVWVSAGRFQHGQHADSIVNILMSLQRWTPYYWEADRYGMVVPLLTSPIHHPLTNLLVESAITIFIALSASFLLIKYFLDDSPIWLAAAALQNIWLFIVVSKAVQFDWFVDQPYGPGLALGAGGLLLAKRQRPIAALFLLLLAEWVNTGAFVALIPIVLLQYVIKKQRRGFVLQLVLVLLSALAGMLGKMYSGAPQAPTQLAPLSSWPSGWLHLLQRAQSATFSDPWLLLCIIVPAGLSLAVWLVRRPSRQVMLVILALVITAVVNWLFVGTLTWVGMNHYAPRYMFSSLFLVATAAAILTVSPFHSVWRRRVKLAPAVATVFVFVTAALTYGIPSRARVHHNLDEKFGAMTSEILATHATLIAGNYWTVWPAVFHANLALYEQHERTMIYGVTYRDKPTLPLWSYQRPVCAAAPLHDTEAIVWLNNSGHHFKPVRTLSTIKLFCEPCPT